MISYLIQQKPLKKVNIRLNQQQEITFVVTSVVIVFNASKKEWGGILKVKITGKNNPNWKGGKVNITCGQCGIIFSAYPSQDRIFCCHDCYTLWQSENKSGKNSTGWDGGPVTLICDWCDNKYTRTRSAVSGSHFCCQDCYSKGQSANKRNIPYDEWESFAGIENYCPAFNEECRESNRNKYDRMCFLSGLPESENITSTNKQRKLSVHHVDMDKNQGCNDKRWKLIPLCMEWHGKTHNELWEFRIIWLLNNIWYKEDDIK